MTEGIRESNWLERFKYKIPHLNLRPEGLVDFNKRIMYPAAFVLGVLYPHNVEAVEIPEDFTHEQGIELLHKGAHEDKVETGAMYLSTVDGEGMWLSVEVGESGGFVDTLGMLRKFITEKNVEPGSQIDTEFLHTHTKHVNVKVGNFTEDTEQGSVPPSNGFAYGDGDTSHIMHMIERSEIDKLEEEFRVKINSVDGVVDLMGIWRHEPLDAEAWKNASSEIYYDWHKFTSLHFQIAQLYDSTLPAGPDQEQQSYINELEQDAREAYQETLIYRPMVQEAIDDWIRISQETPPKELLETPEYETLIDAYAKTGTKMTYKLFSD